MHKCIHPQRQKNPQPLLQKGTRHCRHLEREENRYIRREIERKAELGETEGEQEGEEIRSTVVDETEFTE